MKFYTPFNLSDEHAHIDAVQDFGDTRTSQADADDADINVIVARFTQSGGTLPGAAGVPLAGDFVGYPDLRQSLEIVRDAGEKFERLPSAVRDRFANDVTKFVDFVKDEDNFPELVKLGLANAKEVPVEPPPMRVKVVPD